jgi:hypothetical protein
MESYISQIKDRENIILQNTSWILDRSTVPNDAIVKFSVLSKSYNFDYIFKTILLAVEVLY